MRKSTIKSTILAWAAATAWACTASAQPQSQPQNSAPARSSQPKHECFNARFVTSFSAPDQETVYVRVGVREVWKLKLFAPCLDVDWRTSIALKTRTGGDFICSGLDAELIVPSRAFGRQRCLVSDVSKLSPAEIAALPKRDRP
jgi:hypothetical protein